MASVGVDIGHAVRNLPKEIVRPINHFTPSMWGDFFISYALDNQEWEMLAQKVELLKEEVRKMLIFSKESKIKEKMVLVDTFERLGVSYHFGKEIEEHLEQMFNLISEFGDNNDDDLYTVSLYFRLFRQHGYKMPCSVFEKFKDQNNRFKETLEGDVEGLLNLYEASHLRMHGEDILEEALVFTSTHLKLMAPQMGSLLQEKIKKALELPLHKRLMRLEAPHYISMYEKEESKNDLLVRFSKLDYNFVQMLHKKELSDLSRWWKDLDLLSKYPYARDRVVECHFWGLAVYFEPQYSLGRIFVAKVLSLLSIVDDTYDSYGILEELEIFTKAIQRWDITEMDKLPDYMKRCYQVILDEYSSFDELLNKEGRSYAAHHTKERFKQIVRSYGTEARWFFGEQMPTFTEYLSNGLLTSTYCLMSAAALMGVKSATKETYDWHWANPKILTAACSIGRLRNDVASCERENKRENDILAIECYTKEHGASKQEALDKFLEISENAWRDMNEELLRTDVPREILERILNIARITDLSYLNNIDGYTSPEQSMKRQMFITVVDPLII
ncbi:unnamed protein product [Fraxinus pennsylvanica]|uniref:Uncharacterized protein n=1 Tax=Fraxinus pennsylvanica TaxID=56036 RepID=A0AAD2ACH9_9LAMI|nr:unnamed protein product [Fraxinus pennsylvanica]